MSLHNDIKAYLDGELDGNRSLQVASLLQSDESLKKEAEDFRAMSATFRLVGEPEVAPTGLTDTLRALHSGQRIEPSRPWWAGRWGIALAGLATVLFLLIAVPSLPQAKLSAKRSMQATAATKSDTASSNDALSVPISPTAEPKPLASAAAPSKRSSMEERGRPTGGGGAGEVAPVTADAAKSMASPIAPEPFMAKQKAVMQNAPGTAKAPVGIATNRLVVQDGTFGIYVKDVSASQARVEALAKGFGGFVASSSLFDAGGTDNKQATIQIRVPVSRFQEAVNALRGVGEIYQQQVSGSDVTAQVADTEGRLKSLRAEADQLRELTKRARNVDEVLQIRDRLSQVEQEIEGMDSQRLSMKDQAAMSTLTVNLAVKPKPVTIPPVDNPTPTSWLDQTLRDAGESFANVVKMIIGLFVHILALSPIWLPILLLSYWGWKVSDKKRGY